MSPAPFRWFHLPDDAVACVGPSGTTTVGALSRRALALADRLAADGAGGRARVVAVEDRAEVLACVIACAQVGDVAVLPGMMAPGALRRLGEQVGAILTDRAVDDARALRLDAAHVAPSGGSGDLVVPAPEAPLIRLSTSGSTGSPKLVDKATVQMLGEARALADAFDWPDAPVLCTVPAQHIYGMLFGVLAPLARGVPFVTDTPKLPGAVDRRVRETGARTLVAVPAQLRTFADPDHTALAGLRLITSSGAPLPAETARAWHTAFGIDITEVFGSTETGGIAWRHQRQDPGWTPLPGVVPTLDDDGRLWIDAPWLAPRAPRPWRTDDLAAPTAGGGFQLRGRADDVVKVAGKRVSVSQVTACLQAAPGVADAVVVPRPDPVRGTRLEALVCPDHVDLAAIRAVLGDRLERVAWPRLVPVPALPRSDTGKLPRAAVLDALDRATGRALALDALEVDGDRATAHVTAPTVGPWLDGHLPGFPLVPGIGLLDAVVGRAARAAWPALGAITALPRVRFQQAVRPGVSLALTLDRRDATVRFSLSGEDGVVAKGSVGFALT